MARVESSIHVSKSTEEIFSFLNRRESHLKFIPRIMEFNQTSPGVFGQVGTTLSGMLNYFGIRIPVGYEILEVEPDRRLAMKGQMGPVLFKDGYALKRNGNGTEIKFWLELSPTGWAKVFAPFRILVGRIHAFETLRNLKRELAKEEIATSGQAPSSQ
jgi:Polyketide cyclase / dehydrase and lipid transport